jgi:hypothetical protein
MSPDDLDPFPQLEASARVLLVRIDALEPPDPALVCLGDLAVAEASEIATTKDNRSRVQLMSNYRRTLLAIAGLLPAHDASQPDEFETFLSDLNGP